MKKCLVLFAAFVACSAMLFSAGPVGACDDDADRQPCKSWDFAVDTGNAPPQALSVYPDACGNPVWYLMRSEVTNTDPAGYLLLDTFIDTAQYCTPLGPIQGWSAGDQGVPSFIVNIAGVNLSCDPWAPITLVAGKAVVHPAPTRTAVVGWKSTVGGHVQVKVNLADLDPWGGDGVNWYVQKNGQIMASGLIDNGGTASWQSDKLKIKEGDFLYVGVGPGPDSDYYYDTTQVDIVIER